MSSRGKRSSILKKRPSVGFGSTESSPSETTGMQKSTKRIGFKPKKSVKEFFATDETATVWCNSYELSADGTPTHLTINETTQKDDTKVENSQMAVFDCSHNKENVVERRTISPNNSSIWNLSLSGCEEERRRMKSDTTVNSSMLNATEKLFLEPTLPHARPVLRPKQRDTIMDSIAMDVSPVKCNGRTGSPRKTIYFHPKQNMFVAIDDVIPVENYNHTSVPKDADVKFFGPTKNLTASESKPNDSRSSRILFQTSNTSNPWRNKSIQTEPRPSLAAADKQSVAINADLSAGWSSHVAGSGESRTPRNTFGNSQFEISEAWNSHPAAALKLKLLQQQSGSSQHGCLFSDEGGGNGNLDDMDSTIAISRTVAEMLGPGSTPASLESTRCGQSQPMHVENNIQQEAMETSLIAEQDHKYHTAKNATATIGDILAEESITDVQLPSNALSRSRPSINPSVIIMDESTFPSQEVVVSVSGHGRAPKTQRLKQVQPSSCVNQTRAESSATFLQVPSPLRTPPSESNRRTIAAEETIAVDDQLPKSVATVSSTPALRQTTYDPYEMEETYVNKPLAPMQEVHLDMSELIFARNSVGLDLVAKEVPKIEMDRPKIHRIPPRALNHVFGSKNENVDKKPIQIYVDSPDKTETQLKKDVAPKTTIYHSIDLTEDDSPPKPVEGNQKIAHQGIAIDLACADENIAQSAAARGTDYCQYDISMGSPAGTNPKMGRGTSAAVDTHSDSMELKMLSSTQNIRPSILFDEQIEPCPMEPRTGSLEDLGQFQISRSVIGEENLKKDVDYTSEQQFENKVVSKTKIYHSIDLTEDDDRSIQIEGESRKQHSRETVYFQDNAIDLTCKDGKISRSSPGRRTDYLPVDISMVSPACTNAKINRGTILTADAMELETMPTRKVQRPTILYDEPLELSAVEFGTGSLDAFRKAQFRKTIVDPEAMEFSQILPSVFENSIPPNHDRKTMLEAVDMNQSPLVQSRSDEAVARSKRLTVMVPQDMDVSNAPNSTVILDPAKNMHQRHTIYLDSDMEQSPKVSISQKSQEKQRKTILKRESMDQTFSCIENFIAPESFKRCSQRATTYDVEDVDETRCTLLPPVNPPNKNEQHTRQTTFAAEDMDETACEPVRQGLQQNVRQNSRITTFESHDMDQSHRAVPNKSDSLYINNAKGIDSIRPSIDHSVHVEYPVGEESVKFVDAKYIPVSPAAEPLSILDNKQFKVDQANPTLQHPDKTLEETVQPFTRQTCYIVQNMDQTHIPIRQTENTNTTGKQLRQTLFDPIDMEATIASPDQRLELSIRLSEKKLRNVQSTTANKLSHSRQTTFAVEDMDQTAPCEPARQSLQPNIRTNSRITNFESPDMDQSRQADIKQSTLSNNCKSPTEKLLEPPSPRCVVNNAVDVDSTRASTIHLLHAEHPIGEESAKFVDSKYSPASRKTLCNTACQTSFNAVSFEKSTASKTVDAAEELENGVSNLHLKAADSPNNNRKTIYIGDDIDETCVGFCGNSSSNKVRQTIFPRDDMEETTVNVQQYCLPAVENRKTLLVEDDMNHTLPRQRLVSISDEMQPLGITCNSLGMYSTRKTLHSEGNVVGSVASPSAPEESNTVVDCNKGQRKTVNMELESEYQTTPMLEQATTSKPKRQTTVEPRDMDSSMVLHPAEVSVIKSPKFLKPAVQSRKIIDITDDADGVESDSAIDVATPSENGRIDGKTDVSFTIPHMPNDYVLRSTALMPPGGVYSHVVKPVANMLQPDDSNATITDVLITVKGISVPSVAIHELSELAELDTVSVKASRPDTTSFAIPPETMASLELKELNEPSFSQPTAQAVSVIQETPKKAGLMPVRRSRGTIFDRVSMELDESGVRPIKCEHLDVLPENKENEPVCEMEMTTRNVPEHVAQQIKNEHDSSEEEFYDAEANQEEPVLEAKEEIVHVSCEAKTRNGVTRGCLKTVEVQDKADQTANVSLPNQTEYKTLNFIDVDALEQTTNAAQKRHLSRISKSVLLELQPDPLNVSISDDYPVKKRKTFTQTHANAATEPICEPRKSTKRVTFHESVAPQPEENIRLSTEPAEDTIPEIETITIKKEHGTILKNRDHSVGQSRLGYSLLTDPSVFIIEESDMLANESNLSLVDSPNVQNASSRYSTLKADDTFYNEVAHLTVNVDQEESVDCITISDDSVTEPVQPSTTIVAEQFPTKLLDISKPAMKPRSSMELNSTVASEVMHELRQQALKVKKTCCGSRGKCRCRNRRTVAAVKRDNTAEVRDSWKHNFDQILESVTEWSPPYDMPLDDRLREILNRPTPTFALPYLEQQSAHLRTTQSVWGPDENNKRLLPLQDASRKVFNRCHLPKTPGVMVLLANKLKSERYRWFLDATNECRTYLMLRHTVLRTAQFKVSFQKPLPCSSSADDVRIIGIECTRRPERLVPSPRLLVAHNEFMAIVQKINLTQLASHCPSLSNLINLVDQLNTLVEQALKRVDQLYRIVRNNGAILEIYGESSQLRIFSVYEYLRDGEMHWNRVSIQFEIIDQIDRSCVSFHKSSHNEGALFPTEQQCGRAGARGLLFLECLLWNIGKPTIDS
ncbi:uncharacterized protein LOC128735699 [Sabethes cyaneus]|uniref:uncharacterized protein LOC128735699 n=1 Tax=Sabethes cyaneus TaxID=53552 RepID=UPI00237D8C3E|nr:uncharacterized protein LOC128735699 [Sabethes cyaneus]